MDGHKGTSEDETQGHADLCSSVLEGAAGEEQRGRRGDPRRRAQKGRPGRLGRRPGRRGVSCLVTALSESSRAHCAPRGPWLRSSPRTPCISPSGRRTGTRRRETALNGQVSRKVDARRVESAQPGVGGQAAARLLLSLRSARARKGEGSPHSACVPVPAGSPSTTVSGRGTASCLRTRPAGRQRGTAVSASRAPEPRPRPRTSVLTPIGRKPAVNIFKEWGWTVPRTRTSWPSGVPGHAQDTRPPAGRGLGAAGSPALTPTPVHTHPLLLL